MKTTGRSGLLSPFSKMDSLYFDNSLYENEMHYKISNILDEMGNNGEYDELCIKCDNCDEFNEILDKLYHMKNDSIKFYGTTRDPYEIIIDPDPRDKYRKFDEDKYLMNKEE